MRNESANTTQTTQGWGGHMEIRELRKAGGPLMAALLGCAAERDQLLREVAKELGVTYGYLSQLRSGVRSVQTISPKFSNACAKYLGISRLEVMVLAGQLTEDSCRRQGGELVDLRNALSARAKAVA